MSDRYVGQARLEFPEGSAFRFFRSREEVELQSRCIAVMRGPEGEACNETEANFFRLVADYVLADVPCHARDMLTEAASRYFDSHPGSEWSIDRVVLFEWPRSLARMHGAILCAVGQGAFRSHLVETRFTATEMNRLQDLADGEGVSVEEFIRRAALTFLSPIEETLETLEVTKRMGESAGRPVPAVRTARMRLADWVGHWLEEENKREARSG